MSEDHRNDEVQCLCCRLSYPRHQPPVFAPRAVPLHPQRGVCWDCLQHQGDSETVRVQRGRHHGKMLRREYEHTRQQLAAARQDLADRPVRIEVRVENLDQEIVGAALEAADDAYRRRDVAMGALSDLRLLHGKRKDDRTRCECGKSYLKCDAAQIVESFEGLAMWERSQAERAWLGEFSYLRHDHPARDDRNRLDDAG
jgi:hypothetical protein